MKRLAILGDYMLQFAARGFIIGASFSGLIFAAMIVGSVLMARQMPTPRVWLIIPAGTAFGTLLGALIGLIDGILVGVIASAFLESCRALSGAVATLATFVLLMVSFYIVATPSNLFGPMTVIFTLPVVIPLLIVAGVTGWEIADVHFSKDTQQLEHA